MISFGSVVLVKNGRRDERSLREIPPGGGEVEVVVVDDEGCGGGGTIPLAARAQSVANSDLRSNKSTKLPVFVLDLTKLPTAGMAVVLNSRRR